MTLENIKLDVDYVRSQFPAFKDPLSKDWSFFENAGGSYVPKNVIDKLTEFMTSTKVQPYAEYPMSKIAGENMDKATKIFAEMINAKDNEILIGGSTSINLYVLSNALKNFLKPAEYKSNVVLFTERFIDSYPDTNAPIKVIDTSIRAKLKRPTSAAFNSIKS